MRKFDTDKKRIRTELRFWNKIANRYDSWVKSAFEDQYVEFKSKIYSFVGPDDVVLDMGTGTGEIAYHITKKCREVVGVDLSENMIDIASNKSFRQIADNLTFKAGDAYNLPFNNSCFDKVICCNVLQTMKEPILAIKEGRRVLKYNGEFISITYCFKDSSLTERIRLIKWVLLYGIPIYWTNFSREGLEAKFKSAGLKIIESSDIWEKPVVLLLRCKKIVE
jgi:ubiquinone/menaquinone biosynthesis C-methylase UbiE